MKRIGITPRLYRDVSTNELRFALDQRWISFLSSLGFCPVVLPPGIDFSNYFSGLNIDGVILSGGGDLSQISNLETDSIRDDFERKILKHCEDHKYPVLGVCRGMQFIGAEFGAALSRTDGHVRTCHSVFDVNGFFGKKSFEVNSYHQYTVSLPVGFIPLAITLNNEIESFGSYDRRLFGIMWHPERNDALTEENVVLFKKIFGGKK